MYRGHVRWRVVVVVSFSAACFFPDLSSLTGDGGSSDGGGDARLEAASEASVDAGKPCDPTKPFSPPRALDVANGNPQYHPTLTADELEMWWGENVPVGDAGFAAHIMHAKRASITSLFGPASIESGIDNGGPVDPNLSDDGLELVFVNGGSIGGFDLFRSVRAKLGDPFGVGVQLPANVLSTGDEISPFQTTDGSLYFPSNRAGWGVYFAQSVGNNTWSAPVLVPELSSTDGEDGVALTHDGLWIYYASRRTDFGTAGGVDVFLGHRATTSDPFGSFTNVSEINTGNDDRVKFVSRDACRIYYESNDKLWVAEKTP